MAVSSLKSPEFTLVGDDVKCSYRTRRVKPSQEPRYPDDVPVLLTLDGTLSRAPDSSQSASNLYRTN